MSNKVSLEDIVSLCKRRWFIYQGSEIYGGLSGTWDYGPLGVGLKRNIMNLWWKTFVENKDNMYGIDAAILMNQNVWKASGHVDTFTDPLVKCKKCATEHNHVPLRIVCKIQSVSEGCSLWSVHLWKHVHK